MPPVISNQLQLPEDQYFHSVNEKSGICIHHTCGGSAASTVDWWKRDPQMVGTAFIIDRDGTIYQTFNPSAWNYQFGLKWNDQEKINFEKRFIGIEIASEGGLIESNGNLYCFNTISSRTLKKPEEAFDYGQPYRGYRYFDKYEKPQIDSVIQLVDFLCREFGIERKTPANNLAFYGDQLIDFKGIIGHANVRFDKSDPIPDNSFWQSLITNCNLQIADIASQAFLSSAQMSEDQIQKLFQENMIQFTQMNRAAGNMVKGLLWELQDNGRNTYIRLRDAVPNGHIVYYDFIQGDLNLIPLAAKSLGFKSWDNNKLEVYDA